VKATLSAGRRRDAPSGLAWRTRVGLVALGWLLALVQLLGVVHRVAHAPVIAGGAGLASVNGASEATAQPALFGLHDEQSLACQLYDQLTHGDLLWSSAVAADAAPCPPAPLAPRVAVARIAAPTHFLARAPPPILG
jgi:hypothetical protein